MSSKCSQCQQDHYRAQGKGGASKLVSGDSKDEKVTPDMVKAFRELTKKAYVDQAKWYLNAFWPDGGEGQAEDVWTITHAFIKLDPKKKAGNELDPVLSAHYLQGLGTPMTALELKEALRRIDVDANGQMAVLEYLLFKFKRLVGATLNNPQGSLDEEDQRRLQQAQAACDALQAALDDLQVKLAAQKEAEAKSRAAEAAVKAAEDEARAAANELKRQEDAHHEAMDALDKKIKDPKTGTVAKGQAVQQLAQLRGTDPLPLRKAKITQEATVRRVESERKVAERAREAQEAKTREVQAAIADTERKAAEAQAFLEEMKKKAGAPKGALWWMEREVIEAKKYMPRSKQ